MHTRSWIGFGILAALGALMTVPTPAAVPHVGFFGTSFDGAAECVRCHPGKDQEVAQSVHYQLRSENRNVAFPGGGMHGMLDRACALRGTNMLVTYDQSCGACHVGIDLPFPDPQTGQPFDWQLANIDCLVCHAAVYDMDNDGVAEPLEDAQGRARVANAQLGHDVWHQDRSMSTAETVGGPVTQDACLRCHEHGQGDYYFKRGTPFTPQTDVHAAAGLKCIDCHGVENHRIARGSRVTDIFGWERQDVEVTCTNCHSATPHQEWPAYNLHTDRLACETCHIPHTSGVARRVWTSTYGVTDGPESAVPVFDSGQGRWNFYEELTAERIRPVHRWFNGGASMLAEPVASPEAFDFRIPTRDTPGAMIYPFRNIVNGMVMDRRGIASDPEFDPRFTMLAAFEAQAPTLIAMGFMRPTGLTDAERAVLGMFPNLLMFDRAEYFATGDVATAVNLGQGTMAAMMSGMDWRALSRDQLIAMGQMTWSGQFTGLDLPDNPNDPTFVADMDPRTVTGSFIQLSHAISREGALRCVQCHSPGGVMDFAALMYSPSRISQLENMIVVPSHDEVVDHLLGVAPLSDAEQIQADVNQDHAVDVADAVMLMSVGR